ncbi:hypothetical protein EDC96DRAFT_543726 [Choanephora cucurbitarum]|nr:hypothetical protein EDC96DRAFT_543726 [Choanephora cucurbitarum]
MGWGTNKPKWKREVVRDHKFANINLNSFYDPSCYTRFSYLSIFLASLKSFAVYVADLWTAVSLMVIGQTTVTPAIPTEISKWIFFVCIIISFLLLIWDMYKAQKILKTDNISLSFASVITHRYLSMKNYHYYCLFRSISKANNKGIEQYAFFVFFQLKGWKRLLLAEAPRQVINVVTLQALAPEWLKIRNGNISFNNIALGKTTVQQILTITMAFSVLIFAISFILVCIAAVLYVPLLCHIRGNLKEYCCHKVDKRIAVLLHRQGHALKVHNRKKSDTSSAKVYSHVPNEEPYHDETYKRLLVPSAAPNPATSNAYFSYDQSVEIPFSSKQQHLHLPTHHHPNANHYQYAPQPSSLPPYNSPSYAQYTSNHNNFY